MAKISLSKAKKDKLFYFVTNAIVIRNSDKRALILKRSQNEKVHPGQYAFPGGKLEWRDLDPNKPTRVNGDVLDFENAIEDLLKRETKEETGLDIDPSKILYLNSVAYIRSDGVPAILAKFVVFADGGKVVLEEGSFDDFAWVNEDEIKNYDCIMGVPEELAESHQRIKQTN